MTHYVAFALPASSQCFNLSLLILMALLLSTPLAAQPAAPSQEARERIRAQVDSTLIRLDLNEAQRDAVAPILEEDMLERIAVLQAHGIDPRDPAANGRPSIRTMRRLRGDIGEIREHTVSRLKEHLTDDQLDVWKQIEEERQTEMRARFRQ